MLLSHFEEVSCGILKGRGNSKDIKAVMATGWSLLKCIEVPWTLPPRLGIKPGPNCLGLILFFISFTVVCHISLSIFNINRKHKWLCSLTKLASFLSKWRDLTQKPVWELRSCNWMQKISNWWKREHWTVSFLKTTPKPNNQNLTAHQYSPSPLPPSPRLD